MEIVSQIRSYLKHFEYVLQFIVFVQFFQVGHIRIIWDFRNYRVQLLVKVVYFAEG